jgi:hypothetical protein
MVIKNIKSDLVFQGLKDKKGLFFGKPGSLMVQSGFHPGNLLNKKSPSFLKGLII